MHTRQHLNHLTRTFNRINTSAAVNLDAHPSDFPVHTQVTEWLLFYPPCDMRQRQRCPLFGLPTTDMFSTATEWGNPQGHSGFSPNMKRNVRPSKRISQNPAICSGNSYFCSTCNSMHWWALKMRRSPRHRNTLSYFKVNIWVILTTRTCCKHFTKNLLLSSLVRLYSHWPLTAG